MLTTEIFQIKANPMTYVTFSGEGKGKLVVILPEKDWQVGEETVSNMVKAIGMDLKDDAYLILHQPDQYINIASFMRQKNCTHVLGFGINPKYLELYIEPKLYAAHQFENFCFILGHTIPHINAHRESKMALWQTLQAVFLNK